MPDVQQITTQKIPWNPQSPAESWKETLRTLLEPSFSGEPQGGLCAPSDGPPGRHKIDVNPQCMV